MRPTTTVTTVGTIETTHQDRTNKRTTKAGTTIPTTAPDPDTTTTVTMATTIIGTMTESPNIETMADAQDMAIEIIKTVTDTTKTMAETAITGTIKTRTRTTGKNETTATMSKMTDLLTSTIALPLETDGPTNKKLKDLPTPSDNINNKKSNKDLEMMGSNKFILRSSSHPSALAKTTNNLTLAIRPGWGIASITISLQN